MPHSTYVRRKSQGLCVKCNTPCESERSHCAACLETARTNRAVLYKERAVEGRCAGCNDFLNGRKKFCATCADKDRLRVKRSRDKYKEAGLCHYCPNPREPDSSVCVTHRESIKARNIKTRERKIKDRQCERCGAALPEEWGFLACQKCSNKGRLKTEQKRRTIFGWYGSKCACCGELRFYFLTLDHVNNNGAQERKLLGGQQQVLSRLWKDQQLSTEYQILCYNCNCAKGMYGSCPHTWGDPDLRPDRDS
jgi:hypothetical protein